MAGNFSIMRKWTLNIHLYGGLLCAPYLIIFGFSSLHFNHHFRFVESQASSISRTWAAPLLIETATNNDALAESVRDSLGLMGWTIPWNMQRDDAGDLKFDLERPGKSYTIRTELKNHSARVEERRKSFWQVLNSLHALGAVPNSKFVLFWGGYTELCTAFVIFAAVSGIYLWVNSKRERWVGLITVLGATLFSIGLMLGVWLWG